MGGGNREWVTTAVLLLLALLTVYIQFALWPMPMTGGFDYRDSGVFAHGGWVIAHGGMPYLDFWDQKPPSIFLLNALAIKLGGSLTAVWWLSLITALLALEQGYKALRMIAGRRYALAGAAIAVVSLMGTMRGGNMVELYALPLRWWLFAMTLKLLEWRSGSMPHRQMKIVGLTIAMGIATGILLALRQNEAVATLALFIGLAWTLLLELRWREFWNILHGGTIGFSIVLGSLTIWLAGGGALDACIDQTFYYNFVHKIAATFMMRLVPSERFSIFSRSSASRCSAGGGSPSVSCASGSGQHLHFSESSWSGFPLKFSLPSPRDKGFPTTSSRSSPW